MAQEHTRRSRLTALELSAIDLTITALQAAGRTIHEKGKDDNPRQQMAEAWADAHHPFVELTEHDREILSQIKALAGQLRSRTSLPDLVDARGKVAQNR
jgi:hypothetical protein